MIVILEGILIEARPLSVVIETNGIGYEVNITITTAGKLPLLGAQVRLFTHVVYREDQHTLYGFADKEERAFFRLLTEKVSGIGPKTALGILSRLSLSVLRTAIIQGDVNLLSKCPGIGKKTAERIVIELRDKLGAHSDATAAIPGIYLTAQADPKQDAIAALVALGFKLPDADKAICKALTVLGESSTAEALIKKALATN